MEICPNGEYCYYILPVCPIKTAGTQSDQYDQTGKDAMFLRCPIPNPLLYNSFQAFLLPHVAFFHYSFPLCLSSGKPASLPR